jgi:hypothetical protein
VQPFYTYRMIGDLGLEFSLPSFIHPVMSS